MVIVEESEPKPGTSKDEDFSELSEPSKILQDTVEYLKTLSYIFRRHLIVAEDLELYTLCLGFYWQFND